MKVFIASLLCVLSLQIGAQKVTPFRDDVSNKYGFKDEAGKTIIPAKYVNASYFGVYDPNFSKVELNGRYGLVDLSGKEVATTKYSSIEKFSEGMALVSTGNDSYGYINTAGLEVVPTVYNGGLDFKNGFAVISMSDKKKKYKRGIVNKTGTLVVPIKYDELYGYSEGVCLFKSGSKQGFLDQNGNEISSTSKYEYVGSLIHGLSLVSKKEKYGYINKMCKEVIPVKFDMGEHFNEDGYGKVRVNETYFLLDTLGTQVANAGFYITSRVNVAKDRWVVVLSKNLEAKEPVYYLTSEKYGKSPIPFGAAITWQIIDDKNNVIKQQRTYGESCAFRVPRDGVYTIQAYYDMNDCTGCRTEDKPNVVTMGYTFNTKL